MDTKSNGVGIPERYHQVVGGVFLLTAFAWLSVVVGVVKFEIGALAAIAALDALVLPVLVVSTWCLSMEKWSRIEKPYRNKGAVVFMNLGIALILYLKLGFAMCLAFTEPAHENFALWESLRLLAGLDSAYGSFLQ